MSAAGIAPAVLFDLDGTLVDSAVDLLQALNRVLAADGRVSLELPALRPVVSKGARAMLAVGFPDLTVEQREARVPEFLSAYAEAVAQHSTPFDGVEDVLATIEAAGVRWGIVTNKPLYLARDVVASMGWSERCAVLVGGDSLPTKKPEPEPLLHACAALALPPSAALYVGDDERDVLAARRAGMKSVIALWGYREAHEDPAGWGADRAAANPLDLLAPGLLAP